MLIFSHLHYQFVKLIQKLLIVEYWINFLQVIKSFNYYDNFYFFYYVMRSFAVIVLSSFQIAVKASGRAVTLLNCLQAIKLSRFQVVTREFRHNSIKLVYHSIVVVWFYHSYYWDIIVMSQIILMSMYISIYF